MSENLITASKAASRKENFRAHPHAHGQGAGAGQGHRPRPRRG